MLNRRMRRHAAGFSLVELMVGVVVGLAVLWGMSSIYVNTSVGSRSTNAANQLNQDLRAVMDIMVSDLRRAGAWRATAGTSNPFAAATTLPTISGTNNECIVYAYDATYLGGTAGAVDAGTDFFGFRLNNNVVQTLDQANSSTLNNTTTACANIAWENLTDERGIQVTSLTFDTIGSQCISFIASSYSATDSTTYTQWKTAAGTGTACTSTASNAPTTYPDTTHTFIEARQINIRITGRSVIDPSLPAVTLNQSVLLANGRVITPP